MESLKLVALDIDGVALNDTFSPVIYSLVKQSGGEYSREVERNVFSQKREDAAQFLINHLNLDISVNDLISMYFSERANYIIKNPVCPNRSLKGFLEICRENNLMVICYGGLGKDHFIRELGEFSDYFHGEKYICTNNFRPGIKEIVKDIYKMEFKNVLFIDDVNRVAEEAKFYNAPFIGVPSQFAFGYQNEDMINTGVKHIVTGLEEINIQLLRQIDKEAISGLLW